MPEKSKKILIVGSSAVYSLEMSYVRAAKNLEYDVKHFDPTIEVNKHIKGSKIGQKIHMFLPVDAWDRKMNRELIIAVKEFAPDCVLLFGPAKIFYGTLATIKIISNATIAWVWPDTPMNLAPHNVLSGPLFDLSATYSEKSVYVFEQLGFKNVQWVPLAGDTFMHRADIVAGQSFSCDISFVGMWRPEREKTLGFILKNFSHLDIALYGKYWQRNCQNKELMKRWKGEGIVGKALGSFFNKSRINLNVIDDTNYPAANMRFFEVCTAGGLQLTSSCPEMENEFRHRRDLVYFENDQDLLDQVGWILNNNAVCEEIRFSGQRLIDNKHSYIHRLQQILNIKS